MAFEDRFPDIDPVMLAGVTHCLVERLTSPDARIDSQPANVWWTSHRPLMHFINAIIPEIEARGELSPKERDAAIAATFFAFRVVGEYVDVAETAELFSAR